MLPRVYTRKYSYDKTRPCDLWIEATQDWRKNPQVTGLIFLVVVTRKFDIIEI